MLFFIAICTRGYTLFKQLSIQEHVQFDIRCNVSIYYSAARLLNNEKIIIILFHSYTAALLQSLQSIIVFGLPTKTQARTISEIFRWEKLNGIEGIALTSSASGHTGKQRQPTAQQTTQGTHQGRLSAVLVLKVGKGKLFPLHLHL
jgi:hypothetical protein